MGHFENLKVHSVSGSDGGLHPVEVQVDRVFGGGHPEGEGHPADERGRPGTGEQQRHLPHLLFHITQVQDGHIEF